MRVSMLFLAFSVALGSSGAARADDLASLSKDPKQWVMPARDYASTRFSPLDQINASNVGKLQAAWMFSVGTQHGQEAAPLIIGDTMYVESSYPNKVFALELDDRRSQVDLYPKHQSRCSGRRLLRRGDARHRL